MSEFPIYFQEMSFKLEKMKTGEEKEATLKKGVRVD